MDVTQAREGLIRELRQFLFFHLGADVKIRIQSTWNGLEVEVEHQRVRPMRLSFRKEEVLALSRDRSRLEEQLLSFLTLHRRS